MSTSKSWAVVELPSETKTVGRVPSRWALISMGLRSPGFSSKSRSYATVHLPKTVLQRSVLAGAAAASVSSKTVLQRTELAGMTLFGSSSRAVTTAEQSAAGGRPSGRPALYHCHMGSYEQV